MIPGLILPAGPALHLRAPGPLVDGHRTNLANVGHKPGKTRFRFGVRSRGHLIFKLWIDDPQDATEFWRRVIRGDVASWTPHPRDYPDALYCVDSVTFLTTTGIGTTYTRPANWSNVANHIEGIGCGYGGGGGGGSGGSAGAYARKNNVSLSSNATYDIGAANAASNTRFIDTGAVARMVAAASTGQGSSTYGPASGCTGDTAYDGGGGGNGAGDGGGGGGAAGPNGPGSAGTSGAFASVTRPGGAADNSTVAGGDTGHMDGYAGTEWDVSHGSGSGGAGAGRFSGQSGGNAVAYGGGGGGTGVSGGTPGVGYQGLIVVTYTPAANIFFGHAIF